MLENFPQLLSKLKGKKLRNYSSVNRLGSLTASSHVHWEDTVIQSTLPAVEKLKKSSLKKWEYEMGDCWRTPLRLSFV